jgi:polyphosphate kinase 2 (PPK2 family)
MAAVTVKKKFRLADLDMDRQLAKDAYKKRLRRLQLRMVEIQQAYRREGRRAVIVVEGSDAAGKGGAIQRLIRRLDPRQVRVWSIGPATCEERGQHYLARFWARLPEPGHIAVFDRSWYGRVLVERVEGLAEPEAWRRAYDEIDAFETMLVDDGIRLVKVFLRVSKDEQLDRFRRRLAAPEKRWKMTPEDMRNRARWDDYLEAYEDMFRRTSTKAARWQVVPADDKRFARVALATAVTGALAKGADLAPPAVSSAFLEAVIAHCGEDMLVPLGLSRS